MWRLEHVIGSIGALFLVYLGSQYITELAIRKFEIGKSPISIEESRSELSNRVTRTYTCEIAGKNYSITDNWLSTESLQSVMVAQIARDRSSLPKVLDIAKEIRADGVCSLAITEQ